MNCKIPFTKDIDFEKKVSEITSISLEHETKVEEDTLKGNFIVSGDFKSHEVSVNKEPFSYILPFEIDLAEDIDRDTIEFMIEDFTYEIVDNTILRINIDFNVIASLKEKEEEPNEEEVLFQDASNAFLEEEEVLDEDERKEPLIEEEKEVLEEQKEEETKEVKEEERESEDTIINSIKSDGKEYATYHIHMVSDGESVETICTMYNSNLNILQDYNDLANITPGDKLIIPENNE